MRLGPALLVALLPLLARANLATGATTLTTASTDEPATTWSSTTTLHSTTTTSTTTTTTAVGFPSTSIATPDTTTPQIPTVLDQQQDVADLELFDNSSVSNDGNSSGTNTTLGFKEKSLTVGYLTAVRGDLKERQGLVISGALTLALEQINNDTNLLPYVRLDLKWNDTHGETVKTTQAIVEMTCGGIAAFFGPEGKSCHVEAIVSQAMNIPMVNYKCSDDKASAVKTFARTEPPDTQVTKSIIALLRYYHWKKFLIVYQDVWNTVAKSLEEQAINYDMTVNAVEKVYDEHQCCELNQPCCQSGYWYEFIRRTKDKTRIYVFLGTAPMLINFMNNMQSAQLFDNGDYMVIYVDMNTYAEREAFKYLWEPNTYKRNSTCTDHEPNVLKRAKSLLVVVPTAPLTSYEGFSRKVREYNVKEPFNFTTPSILGQYKKFVSIYAAYLYDAVYLYAKALDTLLKVEKSLDEKKIDEIASNGTKIIETIRNFGKYESVTGAVMKIDHNGDSEGNFSVLALTKVENPEVETLKSFVCDYQMRPVAQFYEKDDEKLPEYKLLENKQIEWLKNTPPYAEPSCGFNNDLCKNTDIQTRGVIWAGFLGALLFCTVVITISIYRKWKIEQEIEGLLWKIERNDIIGYFDRDTLLPSPSRCSLGSASVNSYESRTGGQVFASTAHFRGVMVRIKELTFSRKRDISRDVMKEMRLLRELRHDNVNSFIGACVEPTSLLLVTDYCAKGSLYDIIENEDIKLDKMFIASLVHDLIKGMLYIHNSLLACHGNLKSSNCVVTSRWVLQVTDFGLTEMRNCAETDSIGEPYQYYRSLFWKAPEHLREPTKYLRGTQKGDVYAFAIILYEIIGRRSPPFGTGGLEPKDIIEKIKEIPENGEEPFRPDVFFLQDTEYGREEYIQNCITECWAEDAESRPDFTMIRVRLKNMKDGKHRNIMDQMMEMMVKYANHLEDLVTDRTRQLHEEKMKTVDLLYRMLPKPVAEKLTMGCGIEPEWFDQVTIYFSDIVGFTAMSAESTPLQVVNFLNDLYTVFDRIIKGYDVYKVETIGDAYMVVSGLPVRNGELHAGEIASMALDLLSAVKEHTILHRPNETVKLRIGIHTGSVVAGVVGLTMPRYCLFGDTVNTASRMESNGEPLKIHISGKCRDALEKIGGYIVVERGLVNMKGKGEVRTYWLEGTTDRAIQRREVDLGELPPLFCRPRRGSPRLNNDSRQASFCAGAGGFGGMNSRRHSSVPRGTSVEVESCSTLHNPSPLPLRNQFIRSNRHALNVPDAGSKLTVDSVFGGSTHHNDTDYTRGLRSRRVLSSIASSCDDPNKSQHALNRAREYKSLDLLPLAKKKKYPPKKLLQRSARSLADCDKFDSGEIQIIAIPDDKFCNNNFPNGRVISHDDSLSDIEEPLLNSRDNHEIILQRKRFGSGTDETMDDLASKRWKSLESVRTEPTSDTPSKKNLPRNSIKSWIVGLFNGNGFPASNTVLNEYTIQLEKESIV